MPLFRKKPIVVEAEQFVDGKPLPFRDKGAVVCWDGDEWYVVTIQGVRTPVKFGEWIILEKGGCCRAYPCDAAVFEATYEPTKGE